MPMLLFFISFCETISQILNLAIKLIQCSPVPGNNHGAGLRQMQDMIFDHERHETLTLIERQVVPKVTMLVHAYFPFLNIVKVAPCEQGRL